MLPQSLQHGTPANAGEGISHVKLYPSVVRPGVRYNLHCVHEGLCPPGAPCAVLVAPHGGRQGGFVLPNHGPRGELPQAFTSCHGANPPAVLEERRELRQFEEVDRGLRDVPICDPVAEPPNPS